MKANELSDLLAALEWDEMTVNELAEALAVLPPDAPIGVASNGAYLTVIDGLDYTLRESGGKRRWLATVSIEYPPLHEPDACERAAHALASLFGWKAVWEVLQTGADEHPDWPFAREVRRIEERREREAGKRDG